MLFFSRCNVYFFLIRLDEIHVYEVYYVLAKILLILVYDFWESINHIFPKFELELSYNGYVFEAVEVGNVVFRDQLYLPFCSIYVFVLVSND